MERNVNVGDWVRFYRYGQFVIGVVQYIRQKPVCAWELEVHTDVGSVDVESILEIRRATVKGEAE